MNRSTTARLTRMGEARWKRQRDRFKGAFERACATLDAIREIPWTGNGVTTSAQNHAYASAIVRYTRARKAWRAFRGWDTSTQPPTWARVE